MEIVGERRRDEAARRRKSREGDAVRGLGERIGDEGEARREKVRRGQSRQETRP